MLDEPAVAACMMRELRGIYGQAPRGRAGETALDMVSRAGCRPGLRACRACEPVVRRRRSGGSRVWAGLTLWVLWAALSCGCGPAIAPTGPSDSAVPTGQRSQRCQTACAQQGLCFEVAGRCVAQAVADCRAAAECRAQGACSLGNEERCVALNPADCEASTACTDRGACDLDIDMGACVATASSCSKQAACLEKGWCGLQRRPQAGEHHCVAATDDHCRKAAICRAEGLCHVKEGQCVARADADCGKATICKTLGRCVAIWDACQQPCRKQPDCAKRGLCVRDEEGGVCWATAAVHCQQSSDCTERGWCSLDHNRCIVGSNLDCFRARVCRKGGACRHWDGEAPGCYHPKQFKCDCPPKEGDGPAEPCPPGTGWGPMCDPRP